MRKSIKIKTNLWAGIILGCISVLLLILLPTQVRMPTYDSGAPSPRIIPAIALVGILISSIVLIVQSVVFKKEKIIEFDFKKELPSLIFIALFLLYVVLLIHIGFVAASIIIFSAVLFYEGERKPFIYIFNALMAIGIYLLFKYVFNISLPSFLGLGD